MKKPHLNNNVLQVVHVDAVTLGEASQLHDFVLQQGEILLRLRQLQVLVGKFGLQLD